MGSLVGMGNLARMGSPARDKNGPIGLLWEIACQ